MKSLLLSFLSLILSAAFLAAGDANRDAGLSVHMLPDRVAAIDGGHGGFSAKDPATLERVTYATPGDLLEYFQRLPASVRENGIWIVLTDPSAYSEKEQAKLKELIKLCAMRKIPVFTCRAMDLPGGWKRVD